MKKQNDSRHFTILALKNKVAKYEDALISIAQFGNGGFEEGNITVSSSYDEPGCAETARFALGKRFCKQFKDMEKE